MARPGTFRLTMHGNISFPQMTTLQLLVTYRNLKCMTEYNKIPTNAALLYQHWLGSPGTELMKQNSFIQTELNLLSHT